MEDARHPIDTVGSLGGKISRRGFVAGVGGITLATMAGYSSVETPQATKLAAAATGTAPSAPDLQGAGSEIKVIPDYNPKAKYTAKYAFTAAKRSNPQAYGEYMAARLNSLTDGEISVNIMCCGQLGGEKENVEFAVSGAQEIANVSTSVTSTVLGKEFSIFDLPYLFVSWEHATKAGMSSPYVGRLRKKALEKGVRLLSIYAGGVRHILYKGTKPVITPGDIKGLKLRVMQSPLDIAQWNATGALATPMNYNEVYNALQQGVIDGLDNTFGSALSVKLDEVVQSVSLTAQRYQMMATMVNEKWFQSLPKKHQEIVVMADKEAALWAIGWIIFEEEVRAIAQLRSKNIKIFVPDRQAFAALMRTVWAKYESDFGKENIQGLADMA